MAKYTVNFSCGHTAEIYIEGSTKDKERRITYLEKHGVCPDCYKKEKEVQKDEAAKKAHTWAIKRGFCELTGTEKQIRWAETLRKEAILGLQGDYKLEKSMVQNIEELKSLYQNMKLLIKWLKTKNEAKFWIETRGIYIKEYIELMEKDQ